MRKHRDEAGEIDEVRHRLGVTTIDIDGIAERLERVEANTERKHNLQRSLPLQLPDPQTLDKPVITLDTEIEVLEESENRQIERN